MSEENKNQQPPVPGSEAELAEQFMKRLTTVDMTVAKNFIDEYTEQTKVPNKQIPEPVFRTIFLPIFMGEVPDDSAPDMLAHWAGLVGGASSPADVVDVKGEKLFEVPPIYDSSVLDTTSRDPNADRFELIFKNYVEDSRVHPAIGARYLADQLSRKLGTNLHGENATETQYSWQPILDYYKVGEKTATAEKKQETAPDDDFNFE